MSDSKFGEVVLAVEINSLDFEWQANELAIENTVLGRYVSNFAAGHEKYLKTLGLHQEIKSIVHFKHDGTASIEFHMPHLKAELDQGGYGIEVIREVIQKKFQQHLSHINRIAKSLSTEKNADDFRGEYESVEALAKCISKSIDIEVTYQFNEGAQTERVEISKLIVDDVTCRDDCVEIVAEVARFDDISGRVVLYKVRGMQGNVTLLVLDELHRDVLLDAQRKRGQVSVKYQPFISQIRPDKDPREGRLIAVGSNFTQMQFT